VSLVIGVAVLLSGLIVDVDATSLPYYDPPKSERTDRDYAIHGAGTIPRQLGEKIVTADAEHRLTAWSAVILANKPYSIVMKELRRLIDEKMGIAQEYDETSTAVAQYSEEWPPWPPLGPRLEISTGDGNQSEIGMQIIYSRPYNLLPDVEGRSELQVVVSDGQPVLKAPVTLIQVRRKDYSIERARFWHLAIPLPYKEQRITTLLTNNEVLLLESLKVRMQGLVLRYFIPQDAVLFKYDKEVWSAIVKTVSRHPAQ
jgi:hypothetical protein